ncbi:hypothetical protein [Pseudomonas sp. B22(2017)]|uniref:hypothetical protein n=1 Tax=Pseudomonas sp. B22(2017) TaxID=1981736 RepID=UPI000A1F3893|nr:hypothetical protein [Pseudomonas sp. B22(2017)]
MTIWAIAYDLDVKGMHAAGYTKSAVTQFYTRLRGCLASNNFEKMKQLSIYTSERPNSLTDAFQASVQLKALPDSDKFIKRLHLFRIEDFNDLLPLVAGRPSFETDPIEQEIEEVFSEAA